MKRSEAVNAINNLKGEAGHKWVVETYNTIKPLPRGYMLQDDDPWCAATVSAVFHSLGYDDLAECGCPVMLDKAKKLGIWQENDAYNPSEGDLIIYDWRDNGKGDNHGEAMHVGIVVNVNGDSFTVREGNKAGSVGNRTMKVNGKTIRGFITPPYLADFGNNEGEVVNPPTSEEKHEEMAGNEVKNTGYVVGKTYTVNVRTALNVRKGAGKNNGLVGYYNLTSNAKKHATAGGALKSGTRVDCLDLQRVGDEVWMLIPSGWICAKTATATYVR